MIAHTETTSAPQMPSGLNHVVVNVRNIEAAHRFWTECLGFRQVGTLRRNSADGRPRPPMRFYSGEVDGKLRHHDIALVEHSVLPAERPEHPQALNHVAVAYPTYEAWQRQIDFLLGRGVKLHGRIDRGVTHSIHLADPDGNEIELVYELPREQWEGDIEAALNRAVERPIVGLAALGEGG
ncbi:MAG TPA: VOC family protein [Acetobacteraceae bacterium]|nr:VOC family protein [Acetobacteraceae bacterium]